MNDIKIKLNKDLRGYKAGKIITLTNVQKGIKLDKYWSKRIKDSKIDNCLEVLTNKKDNIKKKSLIENKLKELKKEEV